MKKNSFKNHFTAFQAIGIFLLLFLVALASFSTTAFAADKYPSEPISILVPFKPGGGADRAMRSFAPYLSETLGVPVNVMNQGGGGGWVAWSGVAKWDPEKDDHRLGLVNLPHVMSYLDPRVKRKENLDSFNWLALHSFDPCMWAVRFGDERFQTLKEFMTYVKDNPGKVVISSTSVGSDDHLGVAYAMKMIPGFEADIVYSNGDADKIAQVLGNHTDMVAGNTGYYTPLLMDSKLQPLAVLHTERWSLWPSVPTFKEVTGVDAVSYAARVLVVAPGLAPEKKQILLDAVKTTMENPEYRMKELNAKNVLMFKTGEDLQALLESAKKIAETVKYWEE